MGYWFAGRQAGREFSSSLSTLHLHFLKGTLGVKRSTTNWAVLQECGHEPLQFYYWFRSAVKLFNSMLKEKEKATLVVVTDLALIKGKGLTISPP